MEAIKFRTGIADIELTDLVHFTVANAGALGRDGAETDAGPLIPGEVHATRIFGEQDGAGRRLDDGTAVTFGIPIEDVPSGPIDTDAIVNGRQSVGWRSDRADL